MNTTRLSKIAASLILCGALAAAGTLTAADTSDALAARIDINGVTNKIQMTPGTCSKDARVSNAGWYKDDETKNKCVITTNFPAAAEWRKGEFSFRPENTGEVSFEIKGQHIPKQDGTIVEQWFLYDDITIGGADIVDGGFEAAAAAWGFGEGTLLEDAKLAHNLKRCVRAWHNCAVSQKIKVTGSLDVKISFWYKILSDKEMEKANKAAALATEIVQHSWARIDVDGLAGKTPLVPGKVSQGGKIGNASWHKDDETKNKCYLWAEFPASDEWRKIEFSFKPEAEGEVVLSLTGRYIEQKDKSLLEKWFLYDDITVDGAAISEGGFQAVTEQDPKGWSWNHEAKLLVEDQKQAHGGAKCAKAWHNVRISQKLKVKAGGEVKITLWEKAFPSAMAK